MHIELQRLKPSPRQPLGHAACGAAIVDLDPPLGVPMAGYSTDGHRAAGTSRALRARATWVEDASGHVVVFVVADLMSATRYLWEATAVALARRVGITRERLILSGTHTHTGPGAVYGQSLYDTLASCWPGFDPQLVAHLVDRLARAVEDARAAAVPAGLGVAEGRLWGLVRQASPAAHQRNDESHIWSDPGMPGHGAPDDLPMDRRQVDPRLRVLSWADQTGRPVAVLATVAAHCTALGDAARCYDSDWYGLLADACSAALGVPVAIAAGPGGDANVLQEGLHPAGPSQGPALVKHVAEAASAVLLDAVDRALADTAPFQVSVHFGELRPGQTSELADAPVFGPVFGVPAMGGGQDARSVLYRWGIAKPGRVGDYFPPEHPQHPKVPALGCLQRLTMWLFSLSGPRTLPMHIVDLGPHRLASIPFEASAVTGFRIERALCTEPQVQDCMIVGYAGAYGGYLVTAQEYDAQEYEGASTLYGRDQARVIRHALARIAARPLPPPQTGVAVFETGRKVHWMK